MLPNGRPAVREGLFGGTGAVRVWDLLGPQSAPPFTAVLFCELDPAGSVGRHQQEEFPEIVVGIEGDGEVRVDDRELSLCRGEVVHLPLGSVLSIANRSAELPLRYLIIKARG
jgi:quercetin dioxygenase-like cupin family protein